MGNLINIVPPNPKKTADFHFTIVQNTSDINPKVMNFVYLCNPPMAKSVGTINTISDMHDLMAKSLDILVPYKTAPSGEWDVNGKNYRVLGSLNEYGVFFSPDFPEFLIPWSTSYEYHGLERQSTRNIITWGVVRSEPGTVSQDPPFRGTKETFPRHREYIAYFGNDGKKLETDSGKTLLDYYSDKFAYVELKAQVFDNLVQYNIWGKSNYEVEQLTEWFQGEYMDNYIGMFREAGIVMICFDRRIRDDTLIQMKNGYHVRSVLYYIRTERVKPIFIGPISQINLNISVQTLQNLIKTNEGRNIESEQDKLISKWIQKNQFGG